MHLSLWQSVFDQMPGGTFFGVLFYLLLLFAALPSSISLVVKVLWFSRTEHFSHSATRTTIIVCAIMSFIGCLTTCTQAAVPLKGHLVRRRQRRNLHPAFCDFMEYLIRQSWRIPVCASGTCISSDGFEAGERHRGNRAKWRSLSVLPKDTLSLTAYVAPVAILAIRTTSFAAGMTLS